MPSLFLILALAGAPAPTEPSEPVRTDAGPQAPTPQRPTVHLVVDEAFSQWLVVRLLEDGYALTTSPAAAHAQLAVDENGEGGWTVTATGGSTVIYDVEPATDAAVLRLELLHRSIDALEDVALAVPARPQPAVSLSVSESSPPSVAPRVAAGILAAGVTLVPAGTPAELRVCAEQGSQDEALQVSIDEEDGDCEAGVGSGDVVSGAAVLPSTRSLVAAAIAKLSVTEPSEELEEATLEKADPDPAVPPAPGPQEDPERPPGLESSPTPARARTPLAGAPYILRGSVAAGFLSRGPATDALVATSLTIGREPGIRGWLELQARPVAVVGPLRIVEIVPAVGFKLRPLTVSRVSLETGLLLGGEIHTYQLRAEPVTDRGTHAALSVEAALGVAIRVWKLHEVHIGLRLGRGPERIHRVQGTEVWRRAAFRIGATAGFSFGMGVAT